MKRTTALFAAIATAAVFTGSAAAMAKMDNGATGGITVQPRVWEQAYQSSAEIPYLSQGVGITREAPGITTEVPYLSHGIGVTREAPAQSTPVLRDKPDGAELSRGGAVEVSLASSDSSIVWSEVLTGFGFGLALALLGALGVLALRQRTFRMQ
jgi:hypothetical protein